MNWKRGIEVTKITEEEDDEDEKVPQRRAIKVQMEVLVLAQRVQSSVEEQSTKGERLKKRVY